MASFKAFNLPDLGEGLTEGEILKWLVAPGETVTLNQPIVEVETAKAAVEIPSPYAGVVTELHHGEGETVDVGSPIITFDTDPDGAPVAGGGSGSGGGATAAMSTAFAPTVGVVDADRRIQGGDLVPSAANPGMSGDVDLPHEPGMAGSPAPKAADEEKIQVLVGSGPKAGSVTRRPRKPTGAASGGPAASTAAAQPVPPARVSAAGVGAHAERLVAGSAEVHVLAKPPVRKLARDLGVDLRAVRGSGPGGVITRDDVTAAADSDLSGGDRAMALPQPDNSTVAGGIRGERIPIRGVRKATAAAMVSSAFTAPHVTEFFTVDMTPTMELVERLKAMREFRELRISPLLIVARALIAACRRYPMINSSWDEAAGEIVVHDAVNLGIAAATPRGLVVPNIKAADRLPLPDLARSLSELVDTARAGKTSPADMQRGTITITNVGVFGVDTGTPILNPGEAAILCFGAVRPQPWVHEGELAIRQVSQLALSFDHRIVDGQLGSEVLAMVGRLLADPSLFAVWS